MRNKLYIIGSLFMMLSVMLSACQPAQPQEIVKTVIVEGKPVEVVVTATSEAAASSAGVSKITPQFNNPDTFMVITGAGEPETLDPAWIYETAGSTTTLNIYEGLVFFKREKFDEYIPALATEWTSSEDGKEWVFTIRQGVKFHKGGTLEPHDVAYTLHRSMLQGRIDGYQGMLYDAFFGPELAMASSKDFAAAYKGKEVFEDLSAAELEDVCKSITSKVVADDEKGTVTFKLNQPVPWLFALMSQQFMGGTLDKEWMIENGDWDDDCKTWTQWADPAAQDTILFNDANGTGPYLLDHWTPGEEIVLTAFQDYWRTEPMWEGGPSGVAKIPRVVIKNITEWGTRLSMFEAGDADYIYVPPVYRPQLDPYIGIRCNTDESTCVDENPDGYIKAFRKIPQSFQTPAQLNWKINFEGGNPFVGSGKLDGNGIPENFFGDLHIRKAFNYCFDFDAMIKDALAGEGIQAQGPILKGMPGYLDQPPAYSYDPAKCEEEFKLADLDGDGIPAGEDQDDVWNKGFYMQVGFNTGNDTRRLASEILKAGIEAVNPKFNIAVVGMPWPVLLENRRQSKLPVYVGGWVEDYHDSNNWAQPFMSSQGAYGRVINLPPDLAKFFDDKILAGAKETDPEKRRVIYEDIQKKAIDEAINIWMYQQLDGLHYQRWVQGFYYNPAYGNPEYGWIYSLTKENK